MRGFETVARDVLERGEAVGDRFGVLQGLRALAWNLLRKGELADSLPILDRAIGSAREDGRLHGVSYLLSVSAEALGLLGRTAQARGCPAEGRAADPAHRDTLLLDYTIRLALAGRGPRLVRRHLPGAAGLDRRAQPPPVLRR